MEQTAVRPFSLHKGERRKQNNELKQLRECMERVREELNRAYTAFNMANDSDWVESCVFEINALQARYNYLFKQAKWLEEEG